MLLKPRFIPTLIALLGVSATGLVSTAQAAQPWDSSETLDGWTRRHKITFTNSGGETLLGFPVMIELTEDDFDLSVLTLATGADVRFLDDNGTPNNTSDDSVLDYEVDWTYVNGGNDSDTTNDTIEARYFVFVPEIKANNTDYIHMYYGATGVPLPSNQNPWDGQNGTDTPVWDGYTGVFHMEETSTNQELNRAGTGSIVGDATNPPSVTSSGVSGSALDYDGTNDFSTLAELYNFTQTTDMSVIFWINGFNANSGSAVFGYQDTAAASADETYGELSGNKLRWREGTTVLENNDNVLDASGWNMLAFTRAEDTTNSDWDIASYQIDSGASASDTNNTAGAPSTNTDLTAIGRLDNYTGSSLNSSTYFDGIIDEIRFADSELSAGWITAEYNSITGVLADESCDNPQWYYEDADNDTYGKTSTGVRLCAQTETKSDLESSWVANSGDCLDSGNSNGVAAADIYPTQTESCNGADDDCDGLTDDADFDDPTDSDDPGGQTNWYADLDGDGDGAGSATHTNRVCSPGAGYVSNDDDCLDSGTASAWGGVTLNANQLNTGVTETCNGVDDDCSGVADDDSGISAGPDNGPAQDWFVDQDGDNYGVDNTSPPNQICAPAETGYSTNDGDCLDTGSDNGVDAAQIYPGQAETCGNNVDDNCSGDTSDEATTVYYEDSDGDGFGDINSPSSAVCSRPNGYVANSTDCFDDDTQGGEFVKPGGATLCDGRVNDCNAGAFNPSTVPANEDDSDGDGYVSCSNPTTTYYNVSGVLGGNDCTDSDGERSPGLPEICDPSNKDEDCDGNADDADNNVVDSGRTSYYTDADEDTYGTGAATRLCDDPGTGANATRGGDCDDTENTINPEGTEVCDDLNTDEDCDGDADDDDSSGDAPVGRVSWWPDADSDTYGNRDQTQTACDAPGAGWINTRGGDCNDSAANINPGQAEVCDGGSNPGTIDENCSGAINEGVTTTFYRDQDGDNFGQLSVTLQRCSAPSGYSATARDCNDDPDIGASTYPGAPELCDGWLNDCDAAAGDDVYADVPTNETDVDGDGYIACDFENGFDPSTDWLGGGDNADPKLDGDCNENLSTGPNFNPGKPEICDTNNNDEDCDGNADDLDNNVRDSGRKTWYFDDDEDNYGDDSHSGIRRCDDPTTGSQDYVLDNTDCDDSKSAIRPGVSEIAGDEVDQNCDGQELCFVDEDDDGYIKDGRPTVNSTNLSCRNAGEARGSEPDGDCQDSLADINPGATEACDQVDNDCDGLIDLDDPSLDQNLIGRWYTDSDSDGFGDENDSGVEACETQAGRVTNKRDCDDSKASIKPGAQEVCDNVDNDCDDLIDDNDPSTDLQGTGTDFYRDVDGDGQGNASVISRKCDVPSGYVADDRDCNDNDNDIYVGRPNDCNTSQAANNYTCDCNGIDNDCDGKGGPDWDVDADGATWEEEDDVGADDCDIDSDDDTVTDSIEWANGRDTDADGLPNIVDPDDDGDNITTKVEDVDGDGDASNDNTDGSFTKSDTIPDYLDVDDDNDGINTIFERKNGPAGYFSFDTDNDDIPNFRDPDDDGDGIETRIEKLYGIDNLNPDHDGDGVNDGVEWGSNKLGAPRDSDKDRTYDPLDTDDDNDGIPTQVEGTGDIDGLGELSPTHPDYCLPNPDLIPNYLDEDSDGDGLFDFQEGAVADSDEDGIPDYRDCNDADGLWGDNDRDGLLNGTEYLLNGDDAAQDLVDFINDDVSVLNPIESPCPDPSLFDSDGDGLSDTEEIDAVTDTNNAALDIENTGQRPNLNLPDFDGDGDLDVCDEDDDNDGLPTFFELDVDGNGILSSNEVNNPVDTDGDGQPDYLDEDDDDDTLLTSEEVGNVNNLRDSDMDGTPDYLDDDDDNDGILTVDELLTDIADCGLLYGEGQNTFSPTATDCDGDGVPNERDARDTNGPDWDNDRDGIPNDVECIVCADLNNDGTANGGENTVEASGRLEEIDEAGGVPAPCATPAAFKTQAAECVNNTSPDSDNDSIPDIDEWGGVPGTDEPVDSDGDGIPDVLDEDDDNDGVPTADEDHNDVDGDGLPGYLDSDSDDDGFSDGEEGFTDSDGDGIPDLLDAEDTPAEVNDTSWVPPEVSNEIPGLCGGGSGAAMLPLLMLAALLRRRESDAA